jgi:PHD/YefM family antitoxin component YafN of YafNO toxin-antitoxin module
MKRIDLKDASAPLSEYASHLTNEPLVLTKNGEPWAAVISLKADDWETVSLGSNVDFISLLRESSERLRREGGISTAEMRKRLGLKKKRRE